MENAMAGLLNTLKAEVESFRSWASAYPVVERPGEWELDYGYEEWSSLYQAFVDFVDATTCREWDAATSGMLLYVIARDNEMGQLVQAVGRNPENLLCLAEQSFALAEPDAKWQIVVELGRVDLPRARVEPILLKFAHDDHEYVRRRALMSLANIKSPLVNDLVAPVWDTGLESDRMAVLRALNTVNSPLLDDYLLEAEVDGRQHLVEYAARIRAGTAN